MAVIPVSTDISTLSLFPIMDYCLTVRGTVGLEAACRGIPVLTGGTGRYYGKGFTFDSTTPRQYLRIARLQNLSPLSPSQVESAERFAYCLFLLRPLPLSSMREMKYDRKFTWESQSNPVEIDLRTRKDWEKAADLRTFAE